MPAFTPVGPTRVVLEVITPSAGGITPKKWRQDATVCPPNWPTDYSLLRGWYLKENLHEFAAAQYAKLNCYHMFETLEVGIQTLSQRVFFARPPVYLSLADLQKQSLLSLLALLSLSLSLPLSPSSRLLITLLS